MHHRPVSLSPFALILSILCASFCISGPSVMSFISGWLDVFILFYFTYMNGAPGYGPNPQYQYTEQAEIKRRSTENCSEPLLCCLCGAIFFNDLLFSYHLETRHQKKLGQSENKRKSVATDSMPTACRVCDRVFYDKVSLLSHSASDLIKDIPNPMLSLQHDHPVPLNSSKAASSSEKKVRVTHQNKIPRITDCSIPPSSSVSKLKAPIMSVVPVNSVQAPVLKQNLPLISYFGSLWGPSQSSLFPTEISKAATSSLSYPMSISQLDASRDGWGLAGAPSSKQKAGDKSSIKQVEKAKEIIVISDDEEENDVETDVDLTLKL